MRVDCGPYYYCPRCPDAKDDVVPSHICAICGCYENPGSKVASKATWICPECAEKIKKLIGGVRK